MTQTASQTASKPLVSIITPVHNAAGYFHETVASVLAQTYTQWEWLIADDGSTDGTREIALELAEHDPRIRVLQVEGEPGLAARGRNLAMRESRGAYLALLDDDDHWRPPKLARQVDYLEARPHIQGVCCWYDVFGDEELCKRRSIVMKTGRVCTREDFLSGAAFQTSTIVFRRECYEALGGMDEDPRLRAAEDSEYFAHLVDAYEIHRIPEVLAEYRLHPASYTRDTLDSANARGWKQFQVFVEKGYFTREQARRRRGMLYYEQARDCLFDFHAPFRRALLQSLATGRPPARAVIMAALMWLPAPILRPFLYAMQEGYKRLLYASIRKRPTG